MEQAGWIDAEWQTTDSGRRARVYRLTQPGKRLTEEEARWARLTEAVGKVLRFA
jgi:DNA-binding PadR family transcriptional regulator